MDKISFYKIEKMRREIIKNGEEKSEQKKQQKENVEGRRGN